MPGVTLDSFYAIPDTAPLWRYQVQMPTIPFSTNSGISSNLTLAPELVAGGSFSFPFVDAEARANSGSYTYYPQFNNIDAIDITFQETGDYRVTSYILAWFDKVFNGHDGTYAPSDYYKHNIVLTMLDHQGNESFRVDYLGTFPTRINNIELSEGDELYKVSCNFSVDSSNMSFLHGNLQS